MEIKYVATDNVILHTNVNATEIHGPAPKIMSATVWTTHFVSTKISKFLHRTNSFVDTREKAILLN
jgi:hypothetical protein